MRTKIRSFTDAGVLIAAARGGDLIALRALKILDDPDREFVSSIYLKLEVLPKALYYKRSEEIRVYEGFFARVRIWAEPLDSLHEEAYRQAQGSGLSALDALHAAAALKASVDEFVTTEKPGKPLFRVPGLPIKSIL
ncbi:MAG: PIN domain-containing protein [Armatimonadetes bacterium]|nr:PIN domain-containing protein [Armatimonadota bacterium]